MNRTARPIAGQPGLARCPDCGEPIAITRRLKLAAHTRSPTCPGSGLDVSSEPEPEPEPMRLAALLHNVKHLLYRVAAGQLPPRPHEQDRLDAARWLAEIESELAKYPKPNSRVSECGGMIEHYYEDK